MKTLVDPEIAARHFAARVLEQGYRLEALHFYKDADGKTLFCKLRAKHPHTREKWIRPMTLVNEEWVLREPAFESGKPLYGLDRLHQSKDQLVVICEGELCADVLAQRGVLSITSGGSQSAAAADWGPLTGKRVLIWPDHDEDGFEYANKVGEILQGLGCDVRFVDTSALQMKRKEDAVDWLKLFPDATVSQIHELPVVSRKNAERAISTVISPFTPQADAGGSGFDANTFFCGDGEFELRESGVFFGRPNKDLGWLCSWMKVVALTRDECSKEWGRLVSVRDGDSVEHSLYVKAESLVGDVSDVLRELAKLGLTMMAGAAAKDLLMAYLHNAPTDIRARSVERFGWNGNLYVTLDGAIGSTKEKVICRSPTAPSFGKQGTLEQWRESVSAAAAGNSRLVFAVACAFAGPLIHLTGIESGGFHLVGPSSIGKTTALRIGASVWGCPAAYIQQWRATANGLEGVASAHNDCLLILDELSQADPVQAAEVAYLLANGHGKIRATRTGSNRPVATWRLLFLSSGEVGLWELLRQAGKQPKVGQEVRLADIEADTGSGLGAFEHIGAHPTAAAFAFAISKAATKFHGVAGQQWLQQIVGDPAGFSEVLARSIQQFVDEVVPVGASGQANRVARRFGLVAVAGELATHCGLTGWQEGESIWAAKSCFHSWLDRFGEGGDKEERNMLRHMVDYFTTYGDSRFQAVDEHSEIRINKRTGFFRQRSGNDPKEFLVPSQSFTSELCSGFDSKRAAQILLKRGWIVGGGDGRSTQRVRIPGLGQLRCYVFQAKMFEDEI